jgi:hypothetical protein
MRRGAGGGKWKRKKCGNREWGRKMKPQQILACIAFPGTTVGQGQFGVSHLDDNSLISVDREVGAGSMNSVVRASQGQGLRNNHRRLITTDRPITEKE